jgi:hypothetical protein
MPFQHNSTFHYQDSKSPLVDVTPAPPYAQQLASTEVHEMDTRHSRQLVNELDGRAIS